jgi:peroxiredoxin
MRAPGDLARWQPARLLIFALLCSLMATGAATASSDTFRDFDGQARSISDYTGDGRWLMVMIWRHDCHVCNMEVEAYAHFHLERHEDDAHVLGLSLDGDGKKAAAFDFIARHDVPFPNLIGELSDVARYFQGVAGSPFYGTPSILLFDPEGTPRAAHAGAVPVSAIEAFIARHSTP